MFYKVLLQSVMLITSEKLFHLFFRKSPNSSPVIPFVAIKCCSFSFHLKAVFFCKIFVSHARATSWFLLIFKYLLRTKQTNENWWKNNWSVESILFKLKWDRKHCISLSKWTKTQWRRADDCTLSVTGLNGPCIIVGKVECRSLFKFSKWKTKQMCFKGKFEIKKLGQSKA